MVSSSDYDLERRVVNFLLGRNPLALRGIRAEAHGGVVTLHGRVHSFYHKQLCLSCAQHVAGVIRLVDAIEVEPPRRPVEVA